MSGHSKKVFLFVDGTNLYAGQHELFGTDKYLDFALFIKVVEDKLKLVFNKIYIFVVKSKSRIEKQIGMSQKVKIINLDKAKIVSVIK